MAVEHLVPLSSELSSVTAPRVLVCGSEEGRAAVVEGLGAEGLVLVVAPARALAGLLAAGGADVVLLEAGADDCVLSGTPRVEVAARLRALAGGGSTVCSEVLAWGPFVLDLSRHVFLHDGVEVHLAPKEFGLLELLLRRRGRVVTRDEVLEVVWGDSSASDRKTVDVHVMRVRAKIEPDPRHPVHLVTVRGLGYRFSA